MPRSTSPAAPDAAAPIEDASIERLHALRRNVESVSRGKEDVVSLALVCLLAEGHLLLEDVPGVGKTTLAHAIARSIDLPFRRIQFTSDLLPSDVLGVSIFDAAEQAFVLHRGPIFNNIVLADEINRASPRTQSALLEAMQERRVTLDHHTHALPRPFLVIATQNPHEFHGTYPLPESQLDRFLLRLSIGYPPEAVERDLLVHRTRLDPVDALDPVLDAVTFTALQDAVDHVHVDDSLLDHLLAVVTTTRRSARLRLGASPRTTLSTLRAAKAHALLQGRTYCLPDDLDAVLVSALSHRVRLAGGGLLSGQGRVEVERVIRELIDALPSPR